MLFNPNSWVQCALLLLISAFLPVTAQTVYKCGGRDSVTYTEKACGGRVVNTDDAPVPKAVDKRRVEQNRAVAQTMRQRDGESAEQFQTRRRRATLVPTDRDECARLEKRMPVEESSLSNPDPAEVSKAQEALDQSRNRFAELRC